MNLLKTPFKTSALNLSICLGLWTGFAAPGFAQGADAPMTAQERLDAIRLSLVEKSLQTPTKVITTSWIDGNGSLRESSSFKNGMEVRGVRVLSYTRDATGMPKANLQTSNKDVLNGAKEAQAASPWSALKELSFKNLLQKLKQASAAPAEAPSAPMCTPQVTASMHQLVSLDLDIDKSSNPVVLSAVLASLQSQWVDTGIANAAQGDAKAWRAVNNLPPPSMANKMTSYERALVSNRPTSLPWQAKVKIRTEVLSSQTLEVPYFYKHPSLALTIDFELVGNDGQSAKFEDHFSLVLDLVRPEWAPAKLSSDSRELIQSQLQTWRTEAEQWLSCQQNLPAVTAINGKQLEINAGSLAGMKKGDELLIANPARFPSQLASKDGAPQTLLARVQAVTPFNSQLVVLAGPAQLAQANWRAWPTETILKEPAVQPANAGSNIRETNVAKRSVKPMMTSSASSGPSAY